MSAAPDPTESAVPGGAGGAAADASGPWPAHHRIGSFEIVTVLRTGDAGVQYRAWDHALAQPVLLEEFMPPALAHRDAQGQMRPSLPAAAAVLERAGRLFIDEARVLAQCNHPHLARVLQLVEAHGTAYRVMPGYSGRPLADLLADGQAPQDEHAIRTLLDDVLGALEAWQARAGAHGGIHPAQVLWLEDGHALLLGPDAASRTPLGGVASLTPPGGASPLTPTSGDPSSAQAIVADLQAVAALARACLKARPADSPHPACSPELLATLDAVLSPEPARWPAHAADFRRWLAHGPQGPQGQQGPQGPQRPAQSAAPVAAPAHAAAPVTAPAPTPPAPVPAAPHTPSPPHPGAGTAAVQDATHPEVDATTSDLIRRVVESIPDRAVPPRTAARPAQPQPQPQPPPPHPPARRSAPVEPPVMPLHPAPAGPYPREPGDRPTPHLRIDRPAGAHEPVFEGAHGAWQPPPPHRSRAARWLLWLSLALLALAAMGLGMRYRLQPGQAVVLGTPATPDPRRAAVRPAAPDAALVPAPAPDTGAPPRPSLPPVGPLPGAAPETRSDATAPGSPPVPPPAPTAAPTPGSPPGPTAGTTSGTTSFATPGANPGPAPPAEPTQAADTPRAACGARTAFALYRCMQQQCALPRWRPHPQCVAFRQTDRVPD